jgi:putative ABC transport system substrate-binding protein
MGLRDHRDMPRMTRRAGLAWAASCACLPTLAFAQQARAARIGVLMPREQQQRAGELLQELQPLGWRLGDNLQVETRVGDTLQRFEQHAAELVGSQVDLIVAMQTPAVLAAKRASSRVPIVISGAAFDPVASGLAKSLAAPAGNVTGIVVPGTHLASKSLELVRELRGSTRRIGVLANGFDPFTPALVKALTDAARLLDIQLGLTMVRNPEDYAAAFTAWRTARTDAVFVQPSLATDQAAALALQHRLPSFSFVRGFAQSGGLLAYLANTRELISRAADYIDRVLRGADPARLPIEQTKSFDLLLNLRTARTLGISVPNLLLLRATEVIE